MQNAESTVREPAGGRLLAKADVLFVGTALLLSILVGVAVGGPDYLPTNDGPNHVFTSYVARHLDDPAESWGRYLRPGAAFSNIGFHSLYGFWMHFLSWRSALRASLVTMALLWAWGVAALAAALGRRRLWLGLFGFAGAVQWILYMGLFSFYLSTAFGFFAIALAMFWPSWPWYRRGMLAACLLGQGMLHPVPAMLTASVIAAVGLSRARWQGCLRELGCLVLMGAPLVLLGLANTNHLRPGAESWIPSLAERAGLAVRAFVSGPAWRSWTIIVAALGSAGLALAGRRWRQDPAEGALLMVGIAFAATAVFAPVHLPGWQFFNMRFSPVAAVLLVVLLPIEKISSVRLRGAVAVSLFVYATASNAWAIGYGRQLREASVDLLSGLDAPIRRTGFRLPLIIEPRAGEPQEKWARTIPYATANWNMGSIFALAQGGVPIYTFAESEDVHQVLWRPASQIGPLPPHPERGFEWWLSEPEILRVPGAREKEVVHLLSYAPYYEDVIFYGRPEEVEWLRAWRFHIDYQRGGLAIARFQACPVELEILPDERGHRPTLLQFGWAPAETATFVMNLPPQPGATTPRRIPVAESGCGEVWFRVLFDEDRDGQASPGDATCREASPAGVVFIPSGSRRAICTPSQALLVRATDTSIRPAR
jgi:hypothetical protein